jgi:hypothetical protein
MALVSLWKAPVDSESETEISGQRPSRRRSAWPVGELDASAGLAGSHGTTAAATVQQRNVTVPQAECEGIAEVGRVEVIGSASGAGAAGLQVSAARGG